MQGEGSPGRTRLRGVGVLMVLLGLLRLVSLAVGDGPLAIRAIVGSLLVVFGAACIGPADEPPEIIARARVRRSPRAEGRERG
jgi:hypothetical protein